MQNRKKNSKNGYTAECRLHTYKECCAYSHLFTACRSVYAIDNCEPLGDGMYRFTSILSGTREFKWIQNGVLHRDDGPAYISKFEVSWVFLGEQIMAKSQEEFENILMDRL